MNFKERILKSQEELNRVWDREFEKNGNSTKSVWDVEPSSSTGRKSG